MQSRCQRCWAWPRYWTCFLWRGAGGLATPRADALARRSSRDGPWQRGFLPTRTLTNKLRRRGTDAFPLRLSTWPRRHCRGRRVQLAACPQALLACSPENHGAARALDCNAPCLGSHPATDTHRQLRGLQGRRRGTTCEDAEEAGVCVCYAWDLPRWGTPDRLSGDRKIRSSTLVSGMSVVSKQL